LVGVLVAPSDVLAPKKDMMRESYEEYVAEEFGMPFLKADLLTLCFSSIKIVLILINVKFWRF